MYSYSNTSNVYVGPILSLFTNHMLEHLKKTIYTDLTETSTTTSNLIRIVT